jgi:hypothetical protein
MFFNIPNINAFISKSTAKYIGEVARAGDCSFPKKFLAERINKPRKNEVPQCTCNNNCVKANDILLCNLNLSSNASLKDWLPLAKNEKNWQDYINEYFESYFKSCQRIDESDDESVREDESED